MFPFGRSPQSRFGVMILCDRTVLLLRRLRSGANTRMSCSSPRLQVSRAKAAVAFWIRWPLTRAEKTHLPPRPLSIFNSAAAAELPHKEKKGRLNFSFCWKETPQVFYISNSIRHYYGGNALQIENISSVSVCWNQLLWFQHTRADVQTRLLSQEESETAAMCARCSPQIETRWTDSVLSKTSLDFVVFAYTSWVMHR